MPQPLPKTARRFGASCRRWPLSLPAVISACPARRSGIVAQLGLYGVLSTAVRQRTPEIGVRMALGASRTRVLQLIVGHGLRLSLVDIAFGLLAALVTSRVIRSMLVGVQPTDPLTFASMAAAFLGIAVVACLIPARRAATLDANAALRDE